MTLAYRVFTRGFFIILALTTLLFLAGIVVLPGYADQAEAQSQPAGAEAPAVTHNTWTSGATMPTPVYYAPTAVLSGEIYVLGGGVTYTSGTTDVQIYNPVTNSWSTGVPLPTAIWAESAAVVQKVIYVIGGAPDASGTYTDAVWAYNPKTKIWTAKANAPKAIAGAVAVVEKNIIHLIGGVGNNNQPPTTGESYNPATDSWTAEAPLLTAKTQFAGGLMKTTILATDGITPASSVTADNEAYDAATNTWASVTSDPNGRSGPCGGTIGSKMYVASGYTTGTTTLTESFQLSKSKWTTLAPIPQATLLPASAVYKGKLYCFGGIATYGDNPFGYVSIYQP